MSTPVISHQRLSYTPEMLSEEIGVSTVTLRDWRAKGKGPRPTRLTGSTVVYRVEDIIAWFDECQRNDAAKGGAK